MSAVPMLQVGSAFLLNACFAWLVGSILARRWMVTAGATGTAVEKMFGRYDLVAASLAAIGSLAAMWAGTAVMAGVGLAEAGPMFWTMVSTTAFGHAGCVTLAAMGVVFLVRAIPIPTSAREWIVLAALAIFAVTRASMGHAGEDGWWTLALGSEALHLGAIGVWAGVVFVSAWAAVGSTKANISLSRTSRYLESMSNAAMAAVLVIVVTGLYNAFLRIGSPANLAYDMYSGAFLVKIAFVGVALLMGGYNKFVGMREASASPLGVQRVKFVLQCESLLLLGVLIAAGVMTSQQPPAAM